MASRCPTSTTRCSPASPTACCPGRVTASWDQRLVGAAERARTCPAVRDDWWARDAQPWPAAADDRDTAVAEAWQLRDAGRDTYTPAEDALGELLPAAHRLNDVHAGMLTDGGARLQLATGPVVVPPHMRKVLRRERTASILCNGPDDGRARLGTPSLVVRSGH